MAISIYVDRNRKLVVVSNELTDKPEDLISEIAGKCKLRSIGRLLIASDPLFPAWRIALIAIKPYLKPGVRAEIMTFTFPSVDKMKSANRNVEQVRGLL